MKIKQRLITGYLIVALLVGVVGYICIDTHKEISEIFDELETDIVPGAIAMAEMHIATEKIHHNTMNYILSGNNKDKDELQAAMLDLEEAGESHLEPEKHIVWKSEMLPKN